MIRGNPQDIVGGGIAGFVVLHFFHRFFYMRDFPCDRRAMPLGGIIFGTMDHA